MVRILTQDFTELDLTPDFEFQVEMENPMFDTGHMPQAFSTQISFPASPTNRRVFGYSPALMRAPKEQRLQVSIWAGGVPYLSGNLVYDGIESGNLMYTFTQKIVDLESKIWDQELLSFTKDSLPAETNSIFRTPLAIRSNNVAMQPFLEGSVDPNLWVKFWNYKTTGKSFTYDSFLPAIPVSAILSWLSLSTPGDLDYMLTAMVIVGRYHEYASEDITAGSDTVIRRQSSGATSSISPSRSSSASSTARGSGGRGSSGVRPGKATDIASFLPDISFLELLKNIGSILCCSFFLERTGLKMLMNSDILESEPLDWRGKISDIYSGEIQPASSYTFGYADDSSENRITPEELNARSTTRVTAGDEDDFNPNIILQGFGVSGNYAVVYDLKTGDIFSGRSYAFGNDASGKPSGYSAPNVYDCDIVFQNAKNVTSEVDDEDSETFDNSSSFHLVRCVPEKIFPTSGSGTWPSDSAATFRMVPIIDPGAVSDGRDNKVYIGVIDNLDSQMTDHGLYYPKIQLERDLLGSHSIRPQDLWEKYHQGFADWLSKRRQVVTAEVKLTASELHAFRLYRPVYFAGRKWIVKKLSIIMKAGTDATKITGSFVEI